MSRRGRRALSVGVLAGLVALPLAGVAAPATAAPADGSLLVIMDVSGSMKRKDASGTTLIDGARQAINRLVQRVPDETPVGLRLYGSTYAGNDQAQGCKDSELAVPIGPASSTGPKIGAAISQAKPTGFTPIGYSLTQAAQDFAPEGRRSIILVSDGEDTCGNPDPCVAARQLAQGGIDVRVDTVGLFLAKNPKARKQLQCVAKATGGSYVPAENAADLTAQLNAVSSRAVQRFQASGTDIDGGPAQTQAAEIEPGTSYVDDIVKGEARWYSFDVTEGQRFTATLTEDGSKKYGCCLSVRLRDSSGDSVDFDNHYGTGSARTYAIEGYPDGARESGTHYFQVELDDKRSKEDYGAVEYEFSVEVEESSGSTSPSPSPSATKSAESTEKPRAADSDSDSEQDSSILLWAVIGVMGVLIVGLVIALALMWRKLRTVGSAPR